MKKRGRDTPNSGVMLQVSASSVRYSDYSAARKGHVPVSYRARLVSVAEGVPLGFESSFPTLRGRIRCPSNAGLYLVLSLRVRIVRRVVGLHSS